MDTQPHRRLQDDIVSKNPIHKMNLERRFKNNERRGRNHFIYNGPARRLTIDRRLKMGDRRGLDESEEIIY